MKENSILVRWLNTAVSGIRFGPDRERVRGELADHIEDKIIGLRRAFPDIPEEEAQERVLSAMGDSEVLKAELAKVHKPWLGWLWKASQWMLRVVMPVAMLISLAVETNYNGYNSLRGRSGPGIYHRITGGDKARLGGYTFQITGAAYLDRMEEQGGCDTLQVGLRVSSPRFWERVDPNAIYDSLTTVAPNGGRYALMGRVILGQYAVEDAWGNVEIRTYLLNGAELCDWDLWYREFAVCLPAEDWEPGGLVTLELNSQAGGISLSVPVTERVVL